MPLSIDDVIRFFSTSRYGRSLTLFAVVFLLSKLYFKLREYTRRQRVLRAYKARTGSMTTKEAEEETIAIVGTGMGGLALAVKLTLAGHKFVMYEKADEVGGTWNFNRYPGAACDVPSHLYSFSFKLNPNWSTRYPPQREILAYLKSVAEHYNFRQHIQFNTAVTKAKFSNTNNKWNLTLQPTDGKERDVIHRHVIFACGQLNIPAKPNIPGIDTFKGPSVHSAQWDPSLDLKGKHIGVIGNGATCIQLLPQVANIVEHGTLFSRSANWIEPRLVYSYPAIVKTMFRYIPGLNYIYRCYHWSIHELGYLGFLKDNIGNKIVAKLLMASMQSKIKHRPDLQEKAIPNYKMGCKRILLSNHWFQTLCRDNITVETDSIQEVCEKGIKVISKEKEQKERVIPLDALIWCTGFRSTDFLFPMSIYGVDPSTGAEDYSLTDQAWKEKTRAFRGMTASGFPNMFIMYGPNTNLGHNSIIFMLECQANYITDALSKAIERGYTRIEVTPNAVTQENKLIKKRMQATVWTENCNSWYKKDGEIVNNCPWSTTEYWWMTRTAELDRDFICV